MGLRIWRSRSRCFVACGFVGVLGTSRSSSVVVFSSAPEKFRGSVGMLFNFLGSLLPGCRTEE